MIPLAGLHATLQIEPKALVINLIRMPRDLGKKDIAMNLSLISYFNVTYISLCSMFIRYYYI